MKKVFTLVSIFIISSVCNSQIAIIKDKDGYTNVRNGTNTKAEIVYKLKENEAFWYYDFDEKLDWVEVYIPKDKYSLCDNNQSTINGYIHRSRLLKIEDLPKANSSEINFKYELIEFDRSRHIVDLENGFVRGLDGRKIWGTDGGFPKIEVKSINVSVYGKKIHISKALFTDIYECNSKIHIYKLNDTFFVSQSNSDGAGGYDLLWVINEEGVLQRIVGSII